VDLAGVGHQFCNGTVLLPVQRREFGAVRAARLGQGQLQQFEGVVGLAVLENFGGGIVDGVGPYAAGRQRQDTKQNQAMQRWHGALRARGW
jgi:hypothetical protein